VALLVVELQVQGDSFAQPFNDSNLWPVLCSGNDWQMREQQKGKERHPGLPSFSLPNYGCPLFHWELALTGDR
jgi:hypothetical protein